MQWGMKFLKGWEKFNIWYYDIYSIGSNWYQLLFQTPSTQEGRSEGRSEGRKEGRSQDRSKDRFHGRFQGRSQGRS